MKLNIVPYHLAICRLDANDPVPLWVSDSPFYSVFKTTDELSVVVLQDLVPTGTTHEPAWRALAVDGTLDFAMVGVVSSLVDPLARQGISVFVLSTYNTDYVLIKENTLHSAIEALEKYGHEVSRST